MYARKIPVDAPHLLELTDEELEFLTDATIAQILTPAKFTKTLPREVLKRLEQAREKSQSARLRSRKNNHDNLYPNRTYPLLELLELCRDPTAEPVKPARGLRAKARPKRVTASADRAKRTANQSKDDTEQEGKPCPEC